MKRIASRHLTHLFSLGALALGLMACDQEGGPVDPVPYSVKGAIEQPGMADNFEAQAVKASGIVNGLDRDSYPLTLFLTGEDNLKAYVAEQGLTEAAFLAHPKLADFYNAQLVYEDIGIVELRGSPVGTSETFTSEAGTTITVTKVSDEPDGPAVRNGTVNGVPFYIACSGENEGGLLCYADAPVAVEFDW